MLDRPPPIDLHLPTRTILKGLLWALLVWAALRLWPEVVYLSLSLLAAVALEPFIQRLARRGISRGLSVAILAVFLTALITLFVVFVLPPLVGQVVDVVQDFPSFRDRVQRRLPPDDPILRKVVAEIFLLPTSPSVAAKLNQPLLWGKLAVSAVLTMGIALIATLYLLLDGKRLYAWLLAYVPREHRSKMAATVPEVSNVVRAYVRGQFFISLLFGLFTAVLLTLLDVPAAIALAFFAAACDVIPVVGIIIAMAPAALLALTVSPFAAMTVIASYFLYHQFEAYLLVPRVYGSTLRISTLAVLLALIAGGVLQGALGAVIVLPLVAAYPIIERIWLKGYLGEAVLHDHDALARAAETGRDTAVDAVLQGEKHPGEPRSSKDALRPK